MTTLRSVGRRISDLLAAAAFAEEVGLKNAHELLREQDEPRDENEEDIFVER